MTPGRALDAAQRMIAEREARLFHSFANLTQARRAKLWARYEAQILAFDTRIAGHLVRQQLATGAFVLTNS